MADLAIDIQSGLSSVLGRMKKRYPQHANRISSLDDPCLRRLFYARVAWDKATEIDDGLQGVFATGNVLEPVIERIVSEVGMASTPRWRIVGSQLTLNDALLRKYQISGTQDGLLQVEQDDRWQNVAIVDIKTMSPNVYPRINAVEDLLKYQWTRKYIGQVSMYALGYGIEKCSLLLVNKSNLYDMKFVIWPLDLEHCEGLLQKADAVNKAVEANDPPAGINSPKDCPKCPWFSYCCPPLQLTGNLKIVDDGELEVILDRMGELEPQADEYAELEKARDAMLVKGQDVACGKWLVTWKQTSGAKPQWRKTIVKGVA